VAQLLGSEGMTQSEPEPQPQPVDFPPAPHGLLTVDSSLDSSSHVDSKSDHTLDSASHADSRAEISVTYSPEDRAAMHASKFEKEFVVELDMSGKHGKGTSVGVALDIDTDFQPVSVLKIRKTGLLEQWNKDHPDMAVLVGDEIVKVNDILWHHNTHTFAERIKGQFLAARDKKKGAKDILSLSIQRPRREAQVRFQSQREDLHRQLYSKDFTAELKVSGSKTKDFYQAMGWKLNATVEWEPASIEKLRKDGLVAQYNREHPDAKILAGDEIMQVNHIQWHHNTKTFQDRLKAQFTASQKGDGGAKGTLMLHLRRPRAVKEVLEDQVYTKNYLVELKPEDAKPLGWHFKSGDGSEPPTVDKIKSENSLIALYNKVHPTKQVQINDTLVQVNDAPWHQNSKKFVDRIDKELEKVRPRKGKAQSGEPLKLLMQRKVVQQVQKEWTVTMEMSEGNSMLGWQLNFTEDEFPLTVNKIRSTGLVFEFNQKHPEARIVTGDVIVKVNDHVWNQNSTEFEKALNSEFASTKKGGNISFFLRRPRGTAMDSLATPANSAFFKEFFVRLPIDKGQQLGWQLTAENDTAPVSVSKVRGAGAVHEWNEANPLEDIQVGDIIKKVNTVLWHNNSKMFMDRVNVQVEAARKGKSKGKPTITMLVQRPWRVDGAFQDSSEGADDDSDTVGGVEEDTMGAEE